MNHVLFLLLLFLVTFQGNTNAQDYAKVPYGNESRQYLDIYLAPSPTPTPVYFDAHGNGGTTNMPNSIVDSLKAVGISIVAWESLTSVNTQGQVETGWADAELMFAWVKANAATYNFDTTNFIIGGSSRGSILSWKYAHKANANVRGLYMYNALPDGVWADSSWWYPPNEVTTSSKPIFFVYRFEPGTNDIHDPENGLKVMDTYEALGIGDRDTMVHSIGISNNTDRYQFLVDFALSVIDIDPILGTHSGLGGKPAYKAYPNPFTDDLSIEGLTGNESITVSSLHGEELSRGTRVEELEMIGLPPGLYVITIRRRNEYRSLKVVKY